VRIGQVIGKVTLSRVHPTLVSQRWVIGVPFSLKGLQAGTPDGEDLVILDEMGANVGCQIAFSEGAEAAMPFKDKKPVDAYCVGIIETLKVKG
jgi:ethanolamine utilization protein EutN